jgi:hypothetical protein
MPSYVIVQSGFPKIGETIEATACELNIFGYPDRKTNVPVQVRRVSEQTLCVDGENRRIITCVGENGATTYLVDGSGRAARNRERRVALARAAELLKQLTSTLMPLTAEGAERRLVAESLQLLSNLITAARERAMAPKGVPHDAPR